MIFEALVKAHDIARRVNHALAVGDRLSMPRDGTVPLNPLGEEATRLTAQDVVDLFRSVLSVSFA